MKLPFWSLGDGKELREYLGSSPTMETMKKKKKKKRLAPPCAEKTGEDVELGMVTGW